MNFIKKIFDKKIDESVHLQFQKFSRGEFKDRAIVKVKKVGSKYTIYTTAEFANEFVKTIAEKLGSNKTKITGSIIGTNDLKGELEFKKISQFQGVKNYSIEQEMSGEEIIRLLEKFPKNFFALSFAVGETILKIKPKAPKSSKPKNKNEAPNPDFCKLITTDEKIGNSFVWEKTSFKDVLIAHDFMIESIVVPDGLKSEKDFAVVREKSLRKGKIIRRAVIDGEDMKQEVEFAA